MLDCKSLSKAFKVFLVSFVWHLPSSQGQTMHLTIRIFFFDHGIVGRELSLACSKNVMTKMIVLRWIMITVRRVTQAYCCMQDIAMSNHPIRNIGMFQPWIGATSKKHIASIYSAQIYTPGISPKPTLVTSWKRTFFFRGQFETIEAMDSMKLQLHAGLPGVVRRCT